MKPAQRIFNVMLPMHLSYCPADAKVSTALCVVSKVSVVYRHLKFPELISRRFERWFREMWHFAHTLPPHNSSFMSQQNWVKASLPTAVEIADLWEIYDLLQVSVNSYQNPRDTGSYRETWDICVITGLRSAFVDPSPEIEPVPFL